MAIYRKINTTFWSDPFVCDLPPDKKLFYLYLLTNERTKQCGIYDISKRQISFDLGIEAKKINDNMSFFEKTGKIMYSEPTNEIAIKNWKKFNDSTSPKVLKCIESELKNVKNRVLIEYIYSMDTLSQETPTQEETQAPTEEQEETPTEEELNTDVSASTNPPPAPKIDYDKLKMFFNANRGSLPELKVLTDKRKRQIKSIQETYGKELIIVAIEKAKESDFLQGRTPSGWKASFDWIINPTNFIKIIEDNYLNDGRTKPKPTSEKSNAEIFAEGMQNETFKQLAGVKWNR